MFYLHLFTDSKSSSRGEDKSKLIEETSTSLSKLKNENGGVYSSRKAGGGVGLVSSKSSSSNRKTNLDLVYIIWSVDDWTSWKYQAAIKNNCRTLRTPSNNSNNTGIIKTHEFFLQNLDLKLQVGQTLQLIVCHQTDLIVFKDTNNEDCYKFECAIKV